MNLKSTFLFVLILAALPAITQTIPPTSPAYNDPYDSLIVQGDKGISSGLIIGASSPYLGLAFYNRAIEIEPENPIAYQRKGKAYLDYKMLDEAIEPYTQCLELDPANPHCLYGMFDISFKGSTQYQLADIPQPMMNQIYKNAMAFLKVAPTDMVNETAMAELLGYAIKLGLDNPDAYKKYCPIVLALNLDESNYLVAEELIPAVQATNNNHVLANLYDKLCQYYWNLDNIAKTKEYGLKGLATGVGFGTTYYYLGYTYYYDDKNPTEAIKMLEDGLIKDGPYERASNLVATIQYEEGTAAYKAKNYANTITYLSKFVQNYPESERANAYLGFAQYSSKKYAEAAKSLKKVKEVANLANVNIYYPNLSALIAFAEKPSTTTPAPAVKTTLVELEANEAIYNQGEKLRNAQKYNDAIVKINEALVYYTSTNDNPSIEKCYNSLGQAYHDLETYDKAKEYYAKSIELGASNSSSYAFLALLMYAIDKDYAQAETTLDNGLVKFPDDATLLTTKGRMFISKAYDIYDTKDYEACIPYFQKGLELKIDARGYMYLGYAFNALSRTDEAVAAWENAFYYDESLINEFRDVYDYVQAKKQ